MMTSDKGSELMVDNVSMMYRTEDGTEARALDIVNLSLCHFFLGHLLSENGA